MAVEFHYDREKQAIFAAISSPLTAEEYQLAFEKIVNSEDFAPDTRSLWDLRDMDFTTVDRAFAEKLIQIRGRYAHKRTTKVALVVNSDLAYGMTRMFEILADKLGNETRIFRDYVAAEDWLLKS